MCLQRFPAELLERITDNVIANIYAKRKLPAGIVMYSDAYGVLGSFHTACTVSPRLLSITERSRDSSYAVAVILTTMSAEGVQVQGNRYYSGWLESTFDWSYGPGRLSSLQSSRQHLHAFIELRGNDKDFDLGSDAVTHLRKLATRFPSLESLDACIYLSFRGTIHGPQVLPLSNIVEELKNMPTPTKTLCMRTEDRLSYAPATFTRTTDAIGDDVDTVVKRMMEEFLDVKPVDRIVFVLASTQDVKRRYA